MRLGIVACEAFKAELDLLTEGDGDIVHKEYLEFHLHERPQELRSTIVDKVNGLKEKVDSVFLGYGIRQSLKGVLDELVLPAATLDEDDCVGVFLTTEGYAAERKKCTGTFYAIPYFSQHLGMDWFKRELEKKMPNHEELGVDFRWYMEQLFSGYSRCLLIDTGAGDPVMCEERSREFSDYLGLRLERTNGTLERLRDGLLRSKALARTRTAGRTIHPRVLEIDGSP